MTMRWPDNIPMPVNAVDHAATILAAVDGDIQMALDAVMGMVIAEAISPEYAFRLVFLLRPKGEC
jgi:uncharacterized protein (DUF2342 family)